MSTEQIAHAAGKEVAQFILSDGAFRIVKGTVQIVRLQTQIAAHSLKTGVRELASVAAEKTAQAANRIAQALPKAGESVEAAIAGTEGVFKTTIKNPGVAEACESIAKNPPKMELVKDAGLTKAEWTNHGYKHFPPKNMSWKDIVSTTKNGAAKYMHGINVEKLERLAWERGQWSRNGKPWKVMKFESIIGAKNGVETNCIRVEFSANTIHGHPITICEYEKLLLG